MSIPHPHADADSGLLSPVRAGTPVEAAVSDVAWLQAMLDAEAGLIRAQARVGLVPQAAADSITAAATADRLDLVDLARRSRGAANPVVALVRDFTAVVAGIDPVAAEYVHRGSTSQDILDTATMLVAKRALRLMQADLEHVAAALAGLAVKYRDTAMPGRTLTQHAVPTTFGLKAAGWLQLVLDADERLRLVRDSLPIELGGAAGTLAGYVEYARLDAGVTLDDARYVSDLITAFAAEVGLTEPVLPWHTIRTPVADLGNVLAVLTGALGKIAVDVQSLSRTEVAEVVEPAAAGRGVSSAMPHKRNPVLAIMIRAAAMQVPLMSAGLVQAMVAEDERPAGAWHAEWQPLRECLRLAGGATHTAVELAAGLTPVPDRMRANLDLTGSLVVSERLAIVLAPVLGKLPAKDLVAEAAAEAARTGRALGEVIFADPVLARHVGKDELLDLLDPAGYVGVAPSLVDRALHHYHQNFPAQQERR